MTEVAYVSSAYQTRLRADYGAAIASTIATGWRFADLPAQPDEAIGYVRLGDETDPKLLFVPGFTGGVVANAPFGAAIAHRNFNVIVPDQNRKGLLKNNRGLWDATYSQAQNIGAIITTEKLEHVPLDVVTHSYGSLIFEALMKHARREGWTCFEGSKVAMLAPAGIKRPEWVGGFLRRYYQLLKPEQPTEMTPESYGEFGDEMMRAGVGFFNANRLRAIIEGAAVIKRKVHLDFLFDNGIDAIALVLFAGDKLYGGTVLDKTSNKLRHEQITRFSPLLANGIGSSGHADQQFNPELVAASVTQFLRS